MVAAAPDVLPLVGPVPPVCTATAELTESGWPHLRHQAICSPRRRSDRLTARIRSGFGPWGVGCAGRLADGASRREDRANELENRCERRRAGRELRGRGAEHVFTTAVATNLADGRFQRRDMATVAVMDDRCSGGDRRASVPSRRDDERRGSPRVSGCAKRSRGRATSKRTRRSAP